MLIMNIKLKFVQAFFLVSFFLCKECHVITSKDTVGVVVSILNRVV